jgi:hypothetical protein
LGNRGIAQEAEFQTITAFVFEKVLISKTKTGNRWRLPFKNETFKIQCYESKLCPPVLAEQKQSKKR